MGKALSVAETKAHFSELLETALKEGHVVITRYGKPIAAIVDIEDLVQLQRLQAAREGGGLAELASDWETLTNLPKFWTKSFSSGIAGFLSNPNGVLV